MIFPRIKRTNLKFYWALDKFEEARNPSRITNRFWGEGHE